MLQEIILAAGISTLAIASGIGAYINCKTQIDKYFPLMEKTFSETKTEFGRENYDRIKDLSNKASDLRFNLDKDGGEWYYLFFEKGRKINDMYKDIKNLEKTASILEQSN